MHASPAFPVLHRAALRVPPACRAGLSGIVTWLAFAIPAPAGAQDPPPLFEQVTDTRLPTADLEGFSMDAMPVDVDGDGLLDIVIANEFRPNILLLNTGAGSFSNVSADRLPQVNRDSEDIGIGDFNRDGFPDIVVVTEDDRVNELYLNQGGGFFTDASERLPVEGRSNAVLVAFVNDDLDPDIIIGNNGQNVILIGDGNGFFTDETATRLPAIADVTQDIEFGDVDGDTKPDLLVANEGANRLLLNNGEGVFTEAESGRLPLRVAAEETREADLGDIDDDGDLDIFFANVRLFVGDSVHQNRLLVNNGKGFFADETSERLPADEDVSMDGDFIDLDGDGHLDIVTANFDDLFGQRAEAPYRAYLNDGDGSFEDATQAVFPAGVVGNGLDIEAADFSGDCRLDLFLSSRGGVDRLVFGVMEQVDADCDGVVAVRDNCLETPNPAQADTDDDGIGDACEPFQRGDSNADGDEDIADAITTLCHLFVDGVVLDCEDAADSNDDGDLDLSDAVHLLDFLFLSGSAPPAPGPASCGPDPTLDERGCGTFSPCP